MSAARSVGRPRDEQLGAVVLAATTELLAEQGFAAVTIEAVAARSGVAKTSIYRRWSSKDDLVLDALAAVKGPVPEPPGDSVAGDLHFMAQAMRTQWTDGLHGRLMRRLAVDGSENPEHYRRFRERLIAPRQAAIRAIFERGIAEGTIDDRYDMDWLLALFVAPMIAAGLTHRKRFTVAQVRAHVEILMRGIAP